MNVLVNTRGDHLPLHCMVVWLEDDIEGRLIPVMILFQGDLTPIPELDFFCPLFFLLKLLVKSSGTPLPHSVCIILIM